MPKKKIKPKDLLSAWMEIDSAFENGTAQEAGQLFEQGISGLAPDLLQATASPGMDLLPGDLMSRYRIIRPLGSGGMGDVYLAERADGQYEKRVALKIMSLGFTSPALLARFSRERQIQAELNHPGIAKLLDAGIAEDGRPWFVLDYIQGIPLIEFCKTQDLDQKKAIRLFLQICRAIAYAHDHGIVHRDLKPENILVQGSADKPQPVIVDFGIASRKQDEELTQMGNLPGTPAYSSPEQIKGNYAALDHHSDIFSLGILLYELIDSRRPFDGDSSAEIGYHIIDQDTPPLIHEGISPDLTAIIFKCLEKSPRDRYSSVHKLIEDLQNYQQGKSVAANPVGFWFRARRKVRRYPLLSALALFMTVAMLTLAGISVLQVLDKHRFAAKQAQLAQRYGQVAQQIESNARLIYSRPLHNIEKELAELKRRYLALNKNLGRLNQSSQYVARYALGRAALSLGNIDAARQHLEQAWKAGLKEPLLALRLGQTYVKQYGKVTREMRLLMLSSVQTRKEALDRARKNHLQPALKFLALGAAADHEEAGIAKAILLYATGDTEGALQTLQQTTDTAAWPVTAIIANGNFHLELAENSQFEGNNRQAYQYLLKSENLFHKAGQIARSHPDAITGNCIARTKLIQAGEYQKYREKYGNPALIAPCDALTAVLPNDPDSRIQAARAYVNAARQIRRHGDNPSQALRKAETHVTRILKQTPENPRALRLLGSLRMTQSRWRYESGGDGNALLTDAIEAFEKAAQYTPGDIALLEELALALQDAGETEYNNGGDGNPAYISSNQLYAQLITQPQIALNTQLGYARGLSWQAYYLYSSGRKAEFPLREAIRNARMAVEKSPGNMYAMRILAMAEYTRAEYLHMQMKDPSEASATAFDHYQAIISSNPSNLIARINQLGPLSLTIDFSLNQGISQKKQLALMHQLLLDFEGYKNKAFHAQLIWADYWRYKAKQALLENKTPEKALTKAHAFMKLALKGKVDRYQAIQSSGHLAVFEHTWRQNSGNWNQQAYNDDLLALSRSIDEYPDLPILRALRGKLKGITSKQASDWSQVIADFQSAIAMNPLLENRYGPELRQAILMSER
ncbi:protein kinase domain-containing protein [Thiolapillus sp.]